MASLDVLMAFFLAAGIFAYIPGPAVLYTAAQTIAGGRRAGVQALMGLHIGGYLHVIAAAFGLSAIFQLVPVAYTVVKIAGAIYLIWLGVSMILTRLDTTVLDIAIAEKNNRRTFLNSIAVEVLNPKTALFFIAFLPQFIDPAAHLAVWLQFLILGTIVNLMFSSADLITVYLADATTRRLRRGSRTQSWFRWAGGSVLIALGAKLGWET